MLETLLVKENIVHLGAALYLIGFLFRDPLMLRAFVVAGDLVYILYFYLAPDDPLWGGIFWSSVFILANAVMIGRIVADRTAFGLSAEERTLHGFLDTLTPGEFRRLMRVGRWRTAEEAMVIAEEGQPLAELTYVLDGPITLDKAGHRFGLTPPAFIGEVAFVTHAPASATVTLGEGARFVTFEVAALRRLLVRAPSLRIGLANALNRDMAAKVARA